MANRHLTLSERHCIEDLLRLGYLEAKIAKIIGFSITTIRNELKRNSVKGAYNAVVANNLYLSRRKSNNNKLTKEVKDLVIALLKKGLSPELICGRLKAEGIVNISFKAVYDFIAKNSMKHYLFFKGRRYKYKKEGCSKQGKIVDRVNISERPQEANDRSELYHLEGDTVVGKDHKGAILAKSEDRTASSIKELLCRASNSNKILTATFDNGKEFAKHKELKLETGIEVYFADPYSPWQRGTNENMNRYVRKFIPKGTDLSKISDKYVRELQNSLNNRPKKCLNYLTPNEVHFGIKINIESTI